MRVSSTKNLGSKIGIAVFFGYFLTRVFFSEPWPVRQRTEEVSIRQLAATSVCLTTVNKTKPKAVKLIKVRAVKVDSTWFCKASYYGKRFHGRLMANGQRFNMYDPTTVAHLNLPFGSELRVTNLKNDKKLVVTVKDRGPYVLGRGLDLSFAAADSLGATKDGVIDVKVEKIR